MSNQFHKLTIKNIIKETNDAVSIIFDIPSNLIEEFKFKAGQYLTLKADVNGEDTRRAYSISTAPHENEWKVAVKKVYKGLFSTFAQDLKAGTTLDVMSPSGSFGVKTEGNKNNLFFAAGSGITPVVSMIKDLLHQDENSSIVLFYGNKTADSTIYKSELDDLNAKYANLNVHYLFESGAEVPLNGIVDANRLPLMSDAFLSNFSVDDIYICGPEPMINTIKTYFTANGLDEKNIHFELFSAPAAKKETEEEVIDESAEIMSHVTVIVDDEEFEFDLSSKGKFIMQAAMDADADVPFSCKGGVCCTCKAKVLEGKVKMELNYALDQDEVDEGFVLTCQSRPLTKNVKLSFDEY